MNRPGPRNLITDVAGLRVGNANDADLKSGVTVIICDGGAPAGVQVLGGAPGTRETDLLAPHNSVETVDAVVLAGGSAFGLDAASGAQAALRERGIGFPVGPHSVPIIPAAILFDLMNGGNKDWGRYPPYRDLGHEAATVAAADFETGSHGAGTGALTADFKGGLGSASVKIANGISVGALAAVNAMGAVTVGGGEHFWAAPFELGEEFGGRGLPSPLPPGATEPRVKYRNRGAIQRANTTIAVIATDAVLAKAWTKRLAVAAHDGFARAIWPAHTPFDGDLVFALATGKSGVKPDANGFIDLCAAAAAAMARAIARGVFDASAAPDDTMPTWQARFGHG